MLKRSLSEVLLLCSTLYGGATRTKSSKRYVLRNATYFGMAGQVCTPMPLCSCFSQFVWRIYMCVHYMDLRVQSTPSLGATCKRIVTNLPECAYFN